MAKIFGKRQLVMATLVVALGAAVFVNWYYTKPDAQGVNAGLQVVENTTSNTQSTQSNLGDALQVDAKPKNESEYFTKAKLSRTEAHDKTLEELNGVIKDSKSSAAAVKSATETLNSLSKAIKQETDIENLIKSKISGECLVVINDKSAQVVVSKGSLKDNVLVQIQDIVMKQTGFSNENITIIEAK